jgi:uncharacterized membrane protein (DUF4010 family)
LPLHLAFPPLLVDFGLTFVLSFLLGLQVNVYQKVNPKPGKFGSTRTYTLIGLLGLAAFQVDPSHLVYVVALALLGSLLALFYWRITDRGEFSLLLCLMAAATFFIGPLAVTVPPWLLVLLVVVLILMMGEKPRIHQMARLVHERELSTLATFLALAGVVLPLLPNAPILPGLTVSYHQAWLAVVVISGISYASYLAQSYVFKEKGLLLAALLGGLYSSTATTVVLARRARQQGGARAVSAGIVLATAMMYVRLLAIVGILDAGLVLPMLAPFSAFVVLSVALVLLRYRIAHTESGGSAPDPSVAHPLELATASVFAGLFVLFAGITHYVIAEFGARGLHVLSFLVGMTDIDPFILSLVSGKFHVAQVEIVKAVVIASGSNNLLKAIYALAFSRGRGVALGAAWLTLLCAASLLYAWLAS